MLTEKELEELFEQTGEVSVSLFMPLNHQPDEREVNRIRLKNLAWFILERKYLNN